MATPRQGRTSCAVLVATLLLGAPAGAATVIGTGGKPIPHQMPLVEAVGWISSVLCKPFLLPGPIVVENQMLTLVATRRMKPEEAYRVFLGALNSVGLMVVRDGLLLRIAELYSEPFVTILLRLPDLTADQ